MSTENESNYDEYSPTPGDVLREARLQNDLTLEEVAQKLYLRVSELEAIEKDEIDSSKSVIFTKGYVKSFAKLVGLDVEYVVDLFDKHHNQIKDKANLQSFSKRVAKQANDDRWMMVTYFILIAIIGGVVWWWVQQPDANTSANLNATPASSLSQSSDADILGGAVGGEENTTNLSTLTAQSTQGDIEKSVNDAKSVADDNEIVSPNTELTALDDAIENLDAALDNPSTAELVQSPEVNANDLEFQSETKNSAPSYPAQEQPPVEVLNDASYLTGDESNLVPVVFTFAEDCWVNIVDGTGEAIAYGVKKAGRVMEISGVPPFNVTLGAPRSVSIEYNGEEVDMSGFAGNQIGKLVLPLQE